MGTLLSIDDMGLYLLAPSPSRDLSEPRLLHGKMPSARQRRTDHNGNSLPSTEAILRPLVGTGPEATESSERR